jgi:glutathione S-transferase
MGLELGMPQQLYFAPGACSFVPHVLLEASGAEFEPIMVKLHKGEQYGDAYKALNPHSQVPLLVDHTASGTHSIAQIVAIVGYLHDCYPQMAYLPADPVARAKTMQTLAWMNNTVHATFTHIFMPQKFTNQPDLHAALKEHNTALFAQQLAEIDALCARAAAAGHAFLGGNHLGPLDAYTLTLVRWGSIAGLDPAQWSAAWPHIQKLAFVPAVARVIERERLQLNMHKTAA